MQYETLKVLYKPFSPVRNLKKGFVGEGSSPRYTGRTFKGFVDFFIRFLRPGASLDAFRNLRNFFWGFGETPIFFTVLLMSALIWLDLYVLEVTWELLDKDVLFPFCREFVWWCRLDMIRNSGKQFISIEDRYIQLFCIQCAAAIRI
jgi:hypothetical protein